MQVGHCFFPDVRGRQRVIHTVATTLHSCTPLTWAAPCFISLSLTFCPLTCFALGLWLKGWWNTDTGIKQSLITLAQQKSPNPKTENKKHIQKKSFDQYGPRHRLWVPKSKKPTKQTKKQEMSHNLRMVLFSQMFNQRLARNCRWGSWKC